MSFSEYYAYHTGAVSLRVVLKARIAKELPKVPKPRNKRKPKEVAFPIFGGRTIKIKEGAGIADILPLLTEAHVKRAIKGLPIQNPSGCTWGQLWRAYCERYGVGEGV